MLRRYWRDSEEFSDTFEETVFRALSDVIDFEALAFEYDGPKLVKVYVLTKDDTVLPIPRSVEWRITVEDVRDFLSKILRALDIIGREFEGESGELVISSRTVIGLDEGIAEASRLLELALNNGLTFESEIGKAAILGVEIDGYKVAEGLSLVPALLVRIGVRDYDVFSGVLVRLLILDNEEDADKVNEALREMRRYYQSYLFSKFG